MKRIFILSIFLLGSATSLSAKICTAWLYINDNQVPEECEDVCKYLGGYNGWYAHNDGHNFQCGCKNDNGKCN